MPKVRFINEVSEVDASQGASLLEVCDKADVSVFRGIWQNIHCGSGFIGKLLPMGSCGRCKVWVKPDQVGGVNPPTGKEKIHAKIDGMYRLACQVRVLGDLDVTTKPGGVEVAENMTWDRDPRADTSKWMERWRKAKAGGAQKDDADEPDDADAAPAPAKT